MSRLNKIIDKTPTLLILVILLFSTVISLLLIQLLVLNVNNIYSVLSQYLTSRTLSSISIHRMPFWILITFTLIMILVRTFAVIICIIGGLYISNIKFKFWIILKISLASQLIFVFQYIAELCYFFAFNRKVTYEVLNNYNPFSLRSIFSINNDQLWYYFILENINIFDIVFILVLSFFIKYVISVNYWNGLLFVMKTYGFGFIIWLLTITLYSIV